MVAGVLVDPVWSTLAVIVYFDVESRSSHPDGGAVGPEEPQTEATLLRVAQRRDLPGEGGDTHTHETLSVPILFAIALWPCDLWARWTVEMTRALSCCRFGESGPVVPA